MTTEVGASLLDWTVKATDIAIIFATLIGPIIAVWASEWRQARKAQQDRKEWVFRTLMSTRGAKLKPEHVTAINFIEFAFPRKTSPAVDDARAMYRKHLRSPDSISADDAIKQIWHHKANDLFADLLLAMAQELKVSFTKADVTEESYHPDAYVFSEAEAQQLRTLAIELLRGERALLVSPPK